MASALEFLGAFVAETGQCLPNADVAGTNAGKAILDLPREAQIGVVLAAVDWQARDVNGHGCHFALKSLLSILLRKKLPFTIDHLQQLVDSLLSVNRLAYFSMLAPAGILSAIEALPELPESLRGRLEDLNRKLQSGSLYADERKIQERLAKLLAKQNEPAGPKHFELTTKEAWTHRFREALVAMDGKRRTAWDALLHHCETATASKPSGKWMRQAEELVGTIGKESFASVMGQTLAEIGKPGEPHVTNVGGLGEVNDATLIWDTHSDLLRGLVWCTSLVEDEELIGKVGDAADACFKKVPMVGPRSPKVGNACLHALSAMTNQAAAAQLGRLKTRAKHASVKKQLGKAFDTAAEKAGLSATELEEIAVPTCGLTAIGELKKTFGDMTAWLQVTEEFDTELVWVKPDGKTQSSAPASLKQDHAAELKALKQHEKELGQQLSAQRIRLERLFMEERSWSVADFRARYLDHPLVGAIARKLIWRFEEVENPASVGPANRKRYDGIWHQGKIVDVAGAEMKLTDDLRVSLWHPIQAGVDQVEAWRNWLDGHQVRQPFKQAHREIYVLTDAERQTGAYSNRFAAHILRQHQFSALCLQRGWRYRLQGPFDSANTPEIELPHWGLRAEFWVQAVEQHGEPLFTRGDISHAGIFVYITTDQVRFYRQDSAVPLLLTEVPPLAFSELMRDVDLFVGVCSVGNDPSWSDGGIGGFGRTYWQQYSFGELMPSAHTRKTVLDKIVPRLKIADRCTLGDRFLTVRGDLRTYKIHLGSGNILMEPNDQYLCIVPDHTAKAPRTGKIYLPFEGDNMLSIIISKAFLLADDSKIKDPTILSQINRR